MFIHDLAKYMQEMQASGFIPVSDIDDEYQPDQKIENEVSVFHLPWNIIAKGMHVKDLLQLAQTCHFFRDLVKNSKFLWQHVIYYNIWPDYGCLRHFQRGGDAGNIEALTKMAMAYLYHEGLSPIVKNEDRSVQICGEKAAEMFALLESQIRNSEPLTWIFFRPPWSAVLSAKMVVFERMKAKVSKVDKGNRALAVSFARALALVESDDAVAQAYAVLEEAAQAGSAYARFSLFMRHFPIRPEDTGVGLKQMRELRAIVEMGCLGAELTLAKCYVAGFHGGMAKKDVLDFLHSRIFSCVGTHHHRAEPEPGQMSPAIRHILIDWLIEVASIKDLSSSLVHMTVSMMDRFLERRPVPKSSLQLLGISAMVISSRILMPDIVTIREASWLTDSTYNYEDVVHMITEIIATLKGVVTVPTVVDYLEILCTALGLREPDRSLVLYIAENCLLQADLSKFCPQLLAAGCTMLSQIILRADNPWPTQAEECTRFTSSSVASVALYIYCKCFRETPIVDHRNMTLVAVKSRFASSKYYNVSKMEIDEEFDSWIFDQLTDFLSKALLGNQSDSVQDLDVVMFSPSRTSGCRRKRKECQCSTPDNSSEDGYDEYEEIDDSISDVPAEILDFPDEELAESQDQSSLQDGPSFGGFRISDVSIPSSFQWTQNDSNSRASSLASSSGVSSMLSSPSSNTDGEGGDLTVNSSPGAGSGAAGSLCLQGVASQAEATAAHAEGVLFQPGADVNQDCRGKASSPAEAADSCREGSAGSGGRSSRSSRRPTTSGSKPRPEGSGHVVLLVRAACSQQPSIGAPAAPFFMVSEAFTDSPAEKASQVAPGPSLPGAHGLQPLPVEGGCRGPVHQSAPIGDGRGEKDHQPGSVEMRDWQLDQPSPSCLARKRRSTSASEQAQPERSGRKVRRK